MTPDLPPQNLEAERAVLGSMIRDNLCIADAMQLVKAEVFYSSAHRSIFLAACAIHGRGKPVDLVSLAEELRPSIADIGGYSYLAELWDASPTAANFRYYLDIVRAKYKLRSLIHVANEILRETYEQSSPPDDLLANAEAKILAVSQDVASDRNVMIGEVGKEAFAHYDAVARGKAGGVLTGLHALDGSLGGLRPSELIIIAARPGHGKTSLALQLAESVAREQKVHTLFVSLEMNRIELYTRLLSMHSGVDHFRIKQGRASSEEMDAMIVSGGRIDTGLLEITDWPYQTVSSISANARRLRARKNLGLLVVDYLQLAESENGRAPRHEQVQTMSRGLKLLAKELGIPVVVLAQMNREAEHATDHRPKVWQLRESGSLEQDADTVLLLYRPELYEEFKNDPAMQNIAEVIIGKSRHGPTKTVVLKFHKHLMRFDNREPPGWDGEITERPRHY